MSDKDDCDLIDRLIGDIYTLRYDPSMRLTPADRCLDGINALDRIRSKLGLTTVGDILRARGGKS